MNDSVDYNYQEMNQEDHGYYNRPSDIPGDSMKGYKMGVNNIVQNYQPKDENMKYQPKAETLDYQLLVNQTPYNEPKSKF